MANWENTADMTEALPEITNVVQSTQPFLDKEKYDAARAHGWVAPNPAPPANTADAAEEAVPQILWASQAAKYEWQGDYGEVGPVVPELEKILFEDELKTTRGIQFNR